MIREYPPTMPLMKWMQLLLLAIVLAIGAQQARAQMTGEFTGDLAIVSRALTSTIAATGSDNAEASRVAMEELYRQWRMLRAKNFAAQATDPLFLPEMEKVEARLFAASKLVDKHEWAAARNELLTAEKLLQAVHMRQPGIAKPAADSPAAPSENVYN